MKLRSAATATALNLLILSSAASAHATGPEQHGPSAQQTLATSSTGLALWTARQTSAVTGPGPVADADTLGDTSAALGLDRRDDRHDR
ncbi:hypothetical protein ABCR94_12365 [Streptomyces sp. 21So2-11]|uniref:hypothetical protein n=1 Tax=Streptomyces sp. 21So2-11 TaxID=3144408 RepID=UPI00321C1786